MLLLAGLLSTAALLGCHAQQGARGSDFVQVSTPHFNVYSDVSRARAEKHARKLEQLLSGLQETGWDYHGKCPSS